MTLCSETMIMWKENMYTYNEIMTLGFKIMVIIKSWSTSKKYFLSFVQRDLKMYTLLMKIVPIKNLLPGLNLGLNQGIFSTTS